MILQGDCLVRLKEIPDNSVDSIVTDPPYELGFMGKSWDNTGIANNKEMWKECLRVLKPGAYLLSFGGTRTYHRMASAIEDAGFEVRDMIEWVYGSGFPKSLNIGKAVDKIQGNEREVVGKQKGAGTTGDNQVGNETFVAKNQYEDGTHDITKGTSEWEGWGTALKPAHEPICMARKPLAEKTVAENCLKYGTGGINIDESRVEPTEEYLDVNDFTNKPTTKSMFQEGKIMRCNPNILGRFPANLIHDNSEEVLKEFEKAGSCGAFAPVKSGQKGFGGVIYGKYETGGDDGKSFYKDGLGTPARFFKQCEFTEEDFEYSPFFYCAKASKGERNEGCEGLENKFRAGLAGADRDTDEPLDDVSERFRTQPAKNNHPTVKPIALMEYLIKMVTPKGGIVLDPFAGSGTTLVASKKLGYKYIGIELTDEYLPIINARLDSIKLPEQTTL